jgi:hypothetical protein
MLANVLRYPRCEGVDKLSDATMSQRRVHAMLGGSIIAEHLSTWHSYPCDSPKYNQTTLASISLLLRLKLDPFSLRVEQSAQRFALPTFFLHS